MRTRTIAAIAGVLMTILLVAGCGGGGSGGDQSAAEPAARAEGAAVPEQEADGLNALDAPAHATSSDTDARAVPDFQARAVISTGTVTLRSDDVGQAQFDLMKVVDAHRGEISDEETTTDDDGEISRSRMVVRVPSADFDEVMDELARVPHTDLTAAKRTSEDVTTQVIDTDVRVRAQEKSIERIEALLARAQSIRDIVWIESQLTRRQAELDSLKSQQAWLADQTTLATITVFLEQPPEEPQQRQKEQHEAGFLAGLDAGWDALVTAATGFATVVGALLPFAVVGVLLGVPTWLLLRPLVRRRREQPGPAAAD